jgi:uncharacterized glyoxalase superfamily protein PhnB
MSYAKNCRSNVIPALRYQDPRAMIEWLCATLGFERQAVYEDGGEVVHAQLTFGNGMIMIGPAGRVTEASPFFRQPDEIGGAETQSPCLIVTDCDALYTQAKAAGAKILNDLEEKDYGGKAFSCADPEGHIWHIGTYDPCAS